MDTFLQDPYNRYHEDDLKNEDDLKKEDDLKNEDYLKNEDDIKNEDDLYYYLFVQMIVTTDWHEHSTLTLLARVFNTYPN